MSTADRMEQLNNWAESVGETTSHRLRLLSEALGEMWSDPRRVCKWGKEHFVELVSDWVAFASSVYFASLPLVFVTFVAVVVFGFFGASEPEWFEGLYEHVQALTAVCLLAIVGIYAVRTWNRVRNLFSSPFESDSANFGADVDHAIEGSIDEERKKKYRYWLWGVLVHFVAVRIIIELEDRGHSLSDITFPFSKPDFLTAFSDEMGTIWFVDALQRIIGELTLGEGIGVLFFGLLPIFLIGFGIQLHIQQIKRREEYGMKGGLFEIVRSIWVVLFIIILSA